MSIKKHESYGMISFSHGTIGGEGTSLFGSSIRHNNVIKLKISSCELIRNNSYDRYLASNKFKDVFVEVEMSYSQFAEAITSHNMGMGVPVTIIRQGTHRFEPCPFVDKQSEFRKEYKDFTQEIVTDLKMSASKIDDLMKDKKTLSKSDKELISSALHRTIRELTQNMPFIHEMYLEQMEKTTLEAKGEVEAFVQNKMTQIALQSIGEKQKELLSLEPSDEESQEMEQEDEPYLGPTLGM